MSNNTSRYLKSLWVVVAGLASLSVALIAGILTFAIYMSAARAVLCVGGTFAGTMLLALSVLSVLGVF